MQIWHMARRSAAILVTGLALIGLAALGGLSEALTAASDEPSGSQLVTVMDTGATGSGYVSAIASDTATGPALASALLRPYSAYVVTGAAMEPTLPRGALMLVEAVEPERVRVGDIVTVRTLGALVTRRVVASEAIDAGRLLTLQGDGNLAADGTGAMFIDKAGIVRSYVPYAGYVSAYAGEHGRSALALAGLSLLVLALARPRRIRPSAAIPGTVTAPA